MRWWSIATILLLVLVCLAYVSEGKKNKNNRGVSRGGKNRGGNNKGGNGRNGRKNKGGKKKKGIKKYKKSNKNKGGERVDYQNTGCSIPCVNGACSTTSQCQNNVCTDQTTCQCFPGWSGASCNQGAPGATAAPGTGVTAGTGQTQRPVKPTKAPNKKKKNKRKGRTGCISKVWDNGRVKVYHEQGSVYPWFAKLGEDPSCYNLQCQIGAKKHQHAKFVYAAVGNKAMGACDSCLSGGVAYPLGTVKSIKTMLPAPCFSEVCTYPNPPGGVFPGGPPAFLKYGHACDCVNPTTHKSS